MDHSLTVRDLLLPGEPLDPAEVLAGEGGLGNHVTWAVSLRPYPPAFPRLRGGEIALIATEHLARLDPPATLANVVWQLFSRDAAGVAVRGEVDRPGMEAAEECGLPLLRLAGDAPLPDIEQAIMRVCALYQARREMVPSEEPGAWIDDLLAGRVATSAEAHTLAKRHGYRPATHYSAVYVLTPDEGALQELEARLKREAGASGAGLISRPWAGGLAILLPQGAGALPEGIGTGRAACGIGGEKPLAEAYRSLEEAQLAATASALLHECEPVRFAEMGAERLLVLLYRHHPEELRAFVEETIGPLLRHDAHSATPILPTLLAFVEHGGRLRETAAEIYVHRNTLAYRLDRAAEILGVDLKDPNTRLAIDLAIRALPLARQAEDSTPLQ